MLQSIVQERGFVPFPEHTFERVYMQPFFKHEGVPKGLERWQPTIDAMLEGVETSLPIYLMIDQGIVSPNKTHRRSGLHIDGYWMPEMNAHGGWGGGGHRTAPARDSHYIPRHHTSANEWPVEGLILASDVMACRAVSGEYDTIIGEGGDCSHLDVKGMREHILMANKCYAGNVTMLHESLPTQEEKLRTLVRLNVPGWEPTLH